MKKIYLATEHNKTSEKLIEAVKSAIPQNAILIRPDFVEFAKTISEAIQDMIADCDLVIIDVTHSNPNVMYEFGIANALGKIVIPITASEVSNLPADIRQYFVIQYHQSPEGLSDLATKLSSAIIKTSSISAPRLQKTANLFSGYHELNISEKISNAIQRVDILTVNPLSVMEYIRHSALLKYGQINATIRMLVIDPESKNFLVLGQGDDYRSQLRHGILNLISLIWSISRQVELKNPPELRISNNQPVCEFIRVDQDVYLSLLPYVSNYRNIPVIHLDANDPRISGSIIEYFEMLWKSSFDYSKIDQEGK